MKDVKINTATVNQANVREFILSVLREVVTEENTDVAIKFATDKLPFWLRPFAGMVLDRLLPEKFFELVDYMLKKAGL